MELDTKKVQIIMAEKLMTAKELSQKSKITPYGINQILNKKTSATTLSIGKIAKGLNVPVTEIIKEN